MMKKLHLLAWSVQRRSFRTTTCQKSGVAFNPLLDDGQLILKVNSDDRIVFSTYLNRFKVATSYNEKRMLIKKIQQEHEGESVSIPLCVKNELDVTENPPKPETKTGNAQESHFPFDLYEAYQTPEGDIKLQLNDKQRIYTVEEDVRRRLEAYNKKDPVIRTRKIKKAEPKPDYHQRNNTEFVELEVLKYGNPDPKFKPSDVPCGGCGAKLHCQYESLPGYIPSEAMKKCSRDDLMALLCQRCYFLKYHDMALNMRVRPENYMNALRPVFKSDSLIILVVDVLEAPCGIWQGLQKMLGPRRPVIIVGNKVDLLPPDGPSFGENVSRSLEKSVRRIFERCNIQDVCLVSALTGYGIERLITSIHTTQELHPLCDIHLLGCTNAGKSTLFNALMGSDLCEEKASSLIQKATASPWPGTTLNLLKFPLVQCTGEYLRRRELRLMEQSTIEEFTNQEKLGTTRTYHYAQATLKGTIDRTPQPVHVDRRHISFGIGSVSNSPFQKSSKIQTPTPEIYGKSAKWCYDTPGTIEPSQMLSLLTHDELLMTLPNKMIEPRTYSVNPRKSLLLAGLGRLDVLYSTAAVRLTVFSSSELPVVVVNTVDASAVYRDYLGTEMLAVPIGSKERLQQWRPLQPESLKVVGCRREASSADVVLSSAGFIAVTLDIDELVELRAWTPGARGIFLREPLLPLTINNKRKRGRRSIEHPPHSVYIYEEPHAEIDQQNDYE